MCFYIHKNHSESKKARKDIVCYKRFLDRNNKSKFLARLYKPYVKDVFLSPYKHYPFTKGECYYEDCMIEDKDQFTGSSVINYGFHSYSTLTTAKNSLGYDEILVECIIPAGAMYYHNPNYNEYVSDYIIIGKKTLKWKLREL